MFRRSRDQDVASALGSRRDGAQRSVPNRQLPDGDPRRRV